IFQFETAPSAGPLIAESVNDPACQGVVMVTSLPGYAIATSNDNTSIALFQTTDGNWSNLAFCANFSYDPALGLARSGAYDATTGTLVIGHVNGYLSLWSYNQNTPLLQFQLSVNVQNPNPVNPWGDHTIEDVVLAC